MKPLPIKVITFDLDDTLWHTAPVIRKAEQAMFDWVIAHAPRTKAIMTPKGFDPIKQAVYQQHPELAHQISQVRIIALQQALQQSGYNEIQAIDWATEGFAVFLNARHQVELFDDTVMMLEKLHPQYQLGVLTNGNADVMRTGIGDFFDFAFAAETLNSSKPAPAHFDAAMQSSGAQACQIIHVGDHPEHDIAGALAAGCHAIWFNPAKENWPGISPEPVQVATIADLPEAIHLIAEKQNGIV
jgi:putative hydrolase of the HAD superfamily